MDITFILEAGKRVVASKFNTNFNDVKTAVDALETDVADLQTESSNVILPDGSKDFTNLQSYKANAINNATNATPIVITAVAHGYVTGNKVFIKDVGGNTAANGIFTITKIGADTFSLDDSVGNGAFTTNGTAVIYPSADDNIPNKVYVDTKYINNLGTRTTDISLETGKVTLADISGAINLVMPSDLPIGVEHTAVINFTTTSTSSPTILQTTTTKTITGATNASPIVITAVGNGYVTGDIVVISNVGGNTNANGTWVITKLTNDTFSLNTSSGNASYTSGGTARKANFKWSDKNGGKPPSAYSILSGVRNVLTFKTHDNGANWEAEYTTFGGVETAFVRPNLSANGTLGGATFAVSSSTQNSGEEAWRAVNGSTSDQWTTNATNSDTSPWYKVYNPSPLKITTLSIVNGAGDGNNFLKAGSIYGSNDDSTYTFINSFTNSNLTAGATWNLTVNSSNYYKYYKIAITNIGAGIPSIYGAVIRELLFSNAVYIAV